MPDKYKITENIHTVLQDELEWVKQRREQVNSKDYGAPDNDLTSLGLSGGGIRSAVCNLGFYFPNMLQNLSIGYTKTFQNRVKAQQGAFLLVVIVSGIFSVFIGNRNAQIEARIR